jgi:hypothetical protein
MYREDRLAFNVKTSHYCSFHHHEDEEMKGAGSHCSPDSTVKALGLGSFKTLTALEVLLPTT